MNGSDRILSRIKSDSDASVRAIEEQARQERDRIIADAQHQADKQAAEIAEQTAQKRINKTVDALESYLLGLDDCEYFEALYRLAAQLKGKKGVVLLNQKDLDRKPENFEKRLAAAGLDAAVSSAPADISGGFILKSGDVEENMEFSAIISSKRDEIEDLINKELFAR